MYFFRFLRVVFSDRKALAVPLLRVAQLALRFCKIAEVVVANGQIAAGFFYGSRFLFELLSNRKTLAVPLLRIAQLALRFGNIAEFIIADRLIACKSFICVFLRKLFTETAHFLIGVLRGGELS